MRRAFSDNMEVQKLEDAIDEVERHEYHWLIENSSILKSGVIFGRTFFGVVKSNVPWRCVSASKTGYDWGYDGKAPSDFALNILEAILQEMNYSGARVKCFAGECFSLAWQNRHVFMSAFLESLDTNRNYKIPAYRVQNFVTALLELERENPAYCELCDTASHDEHECPEKLQFEREALDLVTA